MPLDPQLARLVRTRLEHQQASQWEMPIAEVRRSFRNLWSTQMTGEPASIGRTEDIFIPGPERRIRARVYTPSRGARHPLMLYFHGGGYVKGGIDECDTFCRNLARVARHVVVSIDYRLAPEHPFPAALDDACAATAWACTQADEVGAARGPVVVSGESAGGNLAAVTCFRARADPNAQIRWQVLLQPVVDFTMSAPSMKLPRTECLVPREDLDWYYRTYYGSSRSRENPDVSPLFAANLAGLPPALIITAEYDTLRDEGKAYADRLRQAGVRVQYSCYPGMVHGFLQMGGLVKDAYTALDEIAGVVNIGSGSTTPRA